MHVSQKEESPSTRGCTVSAHRLSARQVRRLQIIHDPGHLTKWLVYHESSDVPFQCFLKLHFKEQGRLYFTLSYWRKCLGTSWKRPQGGLPKEDMMAKRLMKSWRFWNLILSQLWTLEMASMFQTNKQAEWSNQHHWSYQILQIEHHLIHSQPQDPAISMRQKILYIMKQWSIMKEA